MDKKAQPAARHHYEEWVHLPWLCSGVDARAGTLVGGGGGLVDLGVVVAAAAAAAAAAACIQFWVIWDASSILAWKAKKNKIGLALQKATLVI